MSNTLTKFVFSLMLMVASSQAALALTPKNRELLENEFAARGAIVYDLYAPLGATEIGVALIEKGQPDWELLVLQVSPRGQVETVLSEAYPKAASNSHPFTLLYFGRHLLTYHATEQPDAHGTLHLQGDLVVRDITNQDQVNELFRLDQVVDLKFSSDGIRSTQNVLWQPAVHFLNQGGRLPIKYNYFRLAYLPRAGEYQLLHNLEPIPDASTEDYANFNNRAIIYYYRGSLEQASKFLEQAWNLSGFSPVVVQHNQDFVKGELINLEDQAQLESEITFDDALMNYWRGEYTLCLQELAAKEQKLGLARLSDFDLVLTGLVLAQQRRWAEADAISVVISQRESGLLADYLYELAKTAGYQGLPQVQESYLQALEVANPDHPGYIAGIARLLRQHGEPAEAQRVLETYLRRPHVPGVDLLEPSGELFSLYQAQGDQAGMEWLTTASRKSPLKNLLGYANLVDYWELDQALVDVEPESSAGIPFPKELLEHFGITK